MNNTLKKLLAVFLAVSLLPAAAWAQFSPGQVLNAAALNAALAAPSITGGSINGSPIGQTNPRAGTFTGVTVTGPLTVAGYTYLAGGVSLAGGISLVGTVTLDSLSVVGNVQIGGSTTFGGPLNKVTITQPASSATLTIANGKTLTYNNSIVMSGTDGTTMTFPSTTATIARTDAAQTFTGLQTFSTGVSNLGNLTVGGTLSATGNVTGAAITGTTITATTKSVAPAGSVGTPGYTFSNDTDTGIYSASPGRIDFATDSLDRTYINTSGVTSLRFNLSDSNTDVIMSRYAAKQLLISGDGTGATTNAGWILGYAGATGTALIAPSTLVPDFTTNYTLAYGSTTATYLNVPGSSGSVHVQVAGADKLTVGTLGAASSGTLSTGAGTALLPALYLSTDTTTGWYRRSANFWTFTDQTNPVLDYGSNVWTYGASQKVSWTSNNAATAGTTDTVLTRYAAKQLMISGDGTGSSAGNIGWRLGNADGTSATSAALAPSTVALSGTLFTLLASAGATYIGSGTGSGTVNVSPNGSTVKTTWTSTAGEGQAITAGTATTDVAALSVTRTNNNAAVATGVKFAFTDTTSAAGFLPFQILCGAGAATNCFSVDKSGNLSTSSNGSTTTPTYALGGQTATGMYSRGSNEISFSANNSLQAFINSSSFVANVVGLSVVATDVGFSRISAGVAGLGNATAGSFSAKLKLTDFEAVGANIILSGLGASTGTPNSLCMNGTTVTVNAALTCTVSSARFKDDIQPFTPSGLMMVAAMKPDTFYYKDRLDRQRVGLIAEDLAAIDPRLAEWDAQGRPNSIDFSALFAVLIKANQEQQRQIVELRGRLDVIQGRNRTAANDERLVHVSGAN